MGAKFRCCPHCATDPNHEALNLTDNHDGACEAECDDGNRIVRAAPVSAQENTNHE
ncbi:hypothetical protein RhoFasB10_03791 [Rhodococcus sp. B10]|nr:hypothetical protein [Rhodococcus sp. B10]